MYRFGIALYLSIALLFTAGCGDSDPMVETPDAQPAICGGALIPFTVYNFDVCDVAEPASDLVLGTGLWTIDTDEGTVTEARSSPMDLERRAALSQNGGPGLQVFSFENLVVEEGATVRVTGSRAPVLIAFGNMQINGTISVAGVGESEHGPGVDLLACGLGAGNDGITQTDGNGDRGGAGGGGGGYGGIGGLGGGIDSALDNTSSGQADGTVELDPLRAGCPGGTGGASDTAGTAGAGGAAGGSIQLISRNQILLAQSGAITAAGGAGSGGQAPSGGGGGGGSGGGILIEASTISIGGHLIASGGGGGQGATNQTDGADGTEADATQLTPPPGGGTAGVGSAGGSAGVSDAQPAQRGTAGQSNQGAGTAQGGGGGGGSHGRIRFNGYGTIEQDETRITPPAISNQK